MRVTKVSLNSSLCNFRALGNANNHCSYSLLEMGNLTEQMLGANLVNMIGIGQKKEVIGGSLGGGLDAVHKLRTRRQASYLVPSPSQHG